MKKLLLGLLLLTAVTAVLAEVGPANRPATLDTAGAYVGPDAKWFINVKNVSGGALVTSAVVVLDQTEKDGYSVNTTTTASGFPFCVLAEACADDAMCSCQTYGVANVNFDGANNDAVAGAPAFLSETTAGKVDGITAPALTDRPIGEFFSAGGADAVMSIFIKLR